MCGIIGLIIKKEFDKSSDLTRLLYNVYAEQSTRGSEGFGIAYYNPKTNQELTRIRTTCDVSLFATWQKNHYDKMNKKGTMIIMHHRFPTCNENKVKYNHPFMDEKHNIALIHNGVISNSDILYKELSEQGHIFESLKLTKDYDEMTKIYKVVDEEITDSEVIVHLLDQNLEETKKAYQDLEEKVYGMLATISINTKTKSLDLYKRNNPIIESENENVLLFSSEFDKEIEEYTDLTKKSEFVSNELRSYNCDIDLLLQCELESSFKGNYYDNYRKCVNYTDEYFGEDEYYYTTTKYNHEPTEFEELQTEEKTNRYIIDTQTKELNKRKYTAQKLQKRIEKGTSSKKKMKNRQKELETQQKIINDLEKAIKNYEVAQNKTKQKLKEKYTCEWCGVEEENIKYNMTNNVNLCQGCINDYGDYDLITTTKEVKK